jgi:hypothetical protein
VKGDGASAIGGAVEEVGRRLTRENEVSPGGYGGRPDGYRASQRWAAWHLALAVLKTFAGRRLNRWWPGWVASST